MDDTDLWIIKKYIDTRLRTSENANDTESFEQCSYAGWAVGEILMRVSEELIFKPPPYVTGELAKTTTEIIEEYAFEMDRYSKTSTDKRRQKLFAIASDTADDLLYFYVHERRKRDGQDESEQVG